MKVDFYEALLKEAKYDDTKTKYLVDGFTNGFSLCYQGDKKVARKKQNLKLRVGSKKKLWNKIMTEVNSKRYAGP